MKWIYKKMKKLFTYFLIVLAFSACGKIRKELDLNDEWQKIEEPEVVEQVVVEAPKEEKICATKRQITGGGASEELWKPHSERTGTVVVLMPQRYKDAQFQLFDKNMSEIPKPVMLRDCCDHNGGREHLYLNFSAQVLSYKKPLTMRFTLGGFEDCFEIPNPEQRYD